MMADLLLISLFLRPGLSCFSLLLAFLLSWFSELALTSRSTVLPTFFSNSSFLPCPLPQSWLERDSSLFQIHIVVRANGIPLSNLFKCPCDITVHPWFVWALVCILHHDLFMWYVLFPQTRLQTFWDQNHVVNFLHPLMCLMCWYNASYILGKWLLFALVIWILTPV